jgi:hypothetical protein
MSSPGNEAAELYWRPLLPILPRLLSRGNREAISPQYGAFDRTFWAWKFTDFPGARFQEAAYALAHLWSTRYADNPLAASDHALAWCRAAMRYWTTLQHGDGSFDEAYPYERSLAATAFTGFYLGEAFLLVADAMPAGERDDVRAALARAGQWLTRNDERHGVLSNHLAAAAAALVVIHRVTGDDRFAHRSRHFLERILARQSPEGWYEEYGGADPGYQTHGSFYLARVWQHTGDKALLESLRRSVAFLAHVIHPDGTLGGEYGSRNTEFYFPAAFEMLAAAVPEAAAIARYLRPFVASQKVAGLWAMDAQNLLPMLNNYLFAAANARVIPPGNVKLACEQEGEWSFPDAGLLVRSTPRYFAIAGLSKGGVLKVFDRRSGTRAVDDCGCWVKLAGGRLASPQTLTRPGRFRQAGDMVQVDGAFYRVGTTVFSPWLFLAFRAFTLTIGRVPGIAYRLKNLLVGVLVRQRRPLDLTIVRRIEFHPDRIIVHDRLDNPGRRVIAAAGVGGKFAAIHMGSARYYHAGPAAGAEMLLDGVACHRLSGGEAVEVERIFYFPE